MFGRIFLFFSLFFSLFCYAWALDYQVQSWIYTTSMVGKNFSIESWNLTKSWSNFFLYNTNYYKYLFFLTGTSQYSWDWNPFDCRLTHKYSYFSDNWIISVITSIYAGYPPFNANWESFYWLRQKRIDNLQDPAQSEGSIKSKTCFDLFDWWPALSVCSMYSFPLRFHSGWLVEYGVGIASTDFYGNKSQRIYYVPDIWSPSYVEWQDPIMIASPVSTVDYSTFLPKKSWLYHHFSGSCPTYDSDFYIVSSKWDWEKSYNLTDTWVYMIEWSDDDHISRSLYSSITSWIPSWFTDSTYCRTTAGYDIISYFDRSTGSWQSFKFYPETGTTIATTDGKICITDLYPDPRGAYVDIADVFGKIAWNGWPLAIIASDSGGYYYATGSQIRYTDTALTGWDSYPASSWWWWWSTDIWYSPAPNGYDCKPVYFSSWSSDGVHIDIPSDNYLYTTWTTTGPPPNSSYNAQLFYNSDWSDVVNVTVKPYYTTLSNVLSGSVLWYQSWSYTSITSSTDYATFGKTWIPISWVEFSAKKNGDLVNIGRVVFATATEWIDFPIQWNDILWYAVFYNANGTYDTQYIRKTSSWTGEVRSEKWWQIVQIVWLAWFSFSHVDLFQFSTNQTIKKYECMNNSFSCYWNRSSTGSFSCAGRINPIYWNEIWSCESVGDYCQPSSNSSTWILDPFHYVDNWILRPIYNQSWTVSGLAYDASADDLFSCEESGIDVLLCVPNILQGIWKRFTVALKNLLDFLYSVSSLSSPKGKGNILWFIPIVSAKDYWEWFRLPYYTTSTGAKMPSVVYTGSKDPIKLNSSMSKMEDNVQALPAGGIKGIYAFAINMTILITLVIVITMIAVAISKPY